MDNAQLKEEALYYHAKGQPGKIEVVPTKETANQRDLSLAYSPGVSGISLPGYCQRCQ